MPEVVRIPEMFTEGIDSLGVTRDIKLRLRVVMEDGEQKEINVGDVGANAYVGPIAEDQAVVHFPADFLNLLEDDESLMYDLALMVVLERLRNPKELG